MFCGSCGNLVDADSKFCNVCGQKITQSVVDTTSQNPYTNDNPIDFGGNPKKNKSNNVFDYQDGVVSKAEDKVNIGLVIVGFLIPLVGLILFICLNKKTPKKANAIGIASLIGVVLSVILTFAIITCIITSFTTNIIDDFSDFEKELYDEFYNEDYNYDYEYDDNYYEFDNDYDFNYDELKNI